VRLVSDTAVEILIQKRLCIGCKYVKLDQFGVHTCEHPRAQTQPNYMHYVTGREPALLPETCSLMRAGVCGPAGILFEPQEDPPF
jgi:hypothetical protein